MFKTPSLLIALVAFIFLCPSCVSTKPSTYFNDLSDSLTLDSKMESIEYNLQSGDILSILITSPSEEASRPFNTTNNYVINTSTASGNNGLSTGYLVNPDGNIQIPLLGNIKAAGITKKQLRDNISKQLLEKKLLIEPIVTIRHINFEVTIIGEVGKATVVTVPGEKITLLKALGLAGDITIFGKKDNVLLIREREGKKTAVRLNLNASSFLSSPYYFMQPGDVVYVENNKNKVISNSRALQQVPILLSTISVIAVVALQLIKK